MLYVLRLCDCPTVTSSSYIQLFNRILAPYVENLDLNQVNYGIGQGKMSIVRGISFS